MSSSAAMSGTPSVPIAPSTLRRVVDLARHAPSVGNTQPWSWQLAPAGLALWADPRRSPSPAGSFGRNLVISCGAALHHALAAAGSLGLDAEVVRLPDASAPDLFATIRFWPTVAPSDAAEIVASIKDRCTDRRRFTAWPVSEARVEELAVATQAWDACGVALADAELRQHVASLVERAEHILPEHRPPEHRPPDVGRAFEPSDGLLAICTAHDDVSSWLAAGVALSAMWLQATRQGLSVVPMSQVVEVPSTRRALEDTLVMPGLRVQLLVRLGWQQITSDASGRTPRRSLDDVLRPGILGDSAP